MKYIEEYRDSKEIQKLVKAIKHVTTQTHKIMEVCGGQTHAILRYGIDKLIPVEIVLMHGPGCPVCVTPREVIDKAIEIASYSGVIFCSFGDMLRVPGTEKDLISAKADGGDVRTIYSPLDALFIARENPHKDVVFFAIGFETTAPANAMTLLQAKELGLSNFHVLVSQFLIPPIIEKLMSSSENEIQGFLGPGHVCTVTGYRAYEAISHKYGVPIIVTGFEPIDILQGIHMCVSQLETGRGEVENQYSRSVLPDGNPRAQDTIRDIFSVTDKKWRGIGEVKKSGFKLTCNFKEFDAEEVFGPVKYFEEEFQTCISGLILQGVTKPNECPEFGKRCTPEMPLGPTMVSFEGTCAAFYQYGRKR